MVELSRRGLLAGAGMMSGAALISPSALAHSGKHIPPGIQLWTVKEDAARDFEGTLKELARIGYKRVEGAGWHGRSAAQVRKALADARLEMPAAHYGLQTLIDETDASLRFAREVGAKYVVASSPAPRRKLDPKKPWSEGVAEAMTLATGAGTPRRWRRSDGGRGRWAALRLSQPLRELIPTKAGSRSTRSFA
jgi:hypothetical protein